MRNYFGDFSWRHTLFERVACLDGERIGLAASNDSRKRDNASIALRQRGSLPGSPEQRFLCVTSKRWRTGGNGFYVHVYPSQMIR
jgi:hypothetical protein